MTFVLLYMASVDNVTIARVMLSRKKMGSSANPCVMICD